MHRNDQTALEELIKPYIDGPLRAALAAMRRSTELVSTPGPVEQTLGDMLEPVGIEIRRFHVLVQALGAFALLLGRHLAECEQDPLEGLLDHYARTLAEEGD